MKNLSNLSIGYVRRGNWRAMGHHPTETMRTKNEIKIRFGTITTNLPPTPIAYIKCRKVWMIFT
jgi:hypothetical protein